jgi:hypothetical protein
MLNNALEGKPLPVYGDGLHGTGFTSRIIVPRYGPFCMKARWGILIMSEAGAKERISMWFERFATCLKRNVLRQTEKLTVIRLCL